MLLWLFVVTFLIKLFSFFPAAVEKYYANGAYPYIGMTLRLLFGWIPFSMGDILYAVVTIYLLRKCYRFCRAAFRKQVKRAHLVAAFEKTAIFLLWVYVLFNLLWGLNYDRPPIHQKMGCNTRRTRGSFQHNCKTTA